MCSMCFRQELQKPGDHHPNVGTMLWVLSARSHIGVAQTVLLLNRVLGAVLTKMANMTKLHSTPLKTRASLLRPPKTTKMTKLRVSRGAEKIQHLASSTLPPHHPKFPNIHCVRNTRLTSCGFIELAVLPLRTVKPPNHFFYITSVQIREGRKTRDRSLLDLLRSDVPGLLSFLIHFVAEICLPPATDDIHEGPEFPNVYHCTHHDYRTEFYYIWIVFGNNPISRDYTESLGLRYRIVWGNHIRKCMSVEELPNRTCFGIKLVIFLLTLPQKESGKRSLAKKWRKKWQKHQKKWPKSDRKSPENEKSDRTPFAALLLRYPDLRVMVPPCPTYQLGRFSSAKENHPTLPVLDPQNECPRVPWIGLVVAFLYSLLGNPEFSRIFRQRFQGKTKLISWAAVSNGKHFRLQTFLYV